MSCSPKFRTISMFNDIAMGFTCLGLILTLLSLAMSYDSMVQSKDQSHSVEIILDKSKSQAEALAQISQAVSTVYLDEFPHYYKALNDELASATRSIKILCDYPIYGYVSSYQDWVSYDATLKRKAAEGISVVMAYRKPGCLRDSLERQFRHSGSDDSWKSSTPTTRDNIERFIINRGRVSASGETVTYDSITFDEFCGMIMKTSDDTLKHYHNFSHKSIPGQLSFHIWIIDDNVAIFSIPVFTANDRERGFRTKDPRLIEALAKSASDHWK